MPKLAIRLTFPYDTIADVFKPFEHVIVYEHEADAKVKRTHVHALVETDVSTDTLKYRIKKIVGFVPKTDWSFKTEMHGEPVHDKLITYMSKGKLEPKYQKGFTQEVVDKYKSEWIERTKPAIDNKDGSKHISSKSTVTVWTMAKELANYINENAERREVYRDHLVTRHDWFEVPPETIIQEAINIHNRHEKAYCDFSLIKVIQTAYGLCDRPKWKDYLVSTVYNKLFPQPK